MQGIPRLSSNQQGDTLQHGCAASYWNSLAPPPSHAAMASDEKHDVTEFEDTVSAIPLIYSDKPY